MDKNALDAYLLVGAALFCIGVYGVMAYSIGQRRRELSIRAALGAQRGDIIRLVLAEGMKLSLLGIGVGLAAAFALARFVETLLFEVRVHDPLVFIASACLLAVVAAVSIYLPARRAARLDPIAALRSGQVDWIEVPPPCQARSSTSTSAPAARASSAAHEPAPP